MANGILIENSSGKVQIDGDYRNYERYQSGVTSVVAAPSPSNAYEHTILFTATRSTFPLVFLRTEDLAYNYHWLGALNAYTGITFLSAVATAVPYVVFVKDQADPVATWGVQVFDGNGDSVLHSDYEYLKVVGDVTFPYDINWAINNTESTASIPTASAGTELYFSINGIVGWNMQQLAVTPIQIWGTFGAGARFNLGVNQLVFKYGGIVTGIGLLTGYDGMVQTSALIAEIPL